MVLTMALDANYTAGMAHLATQKGTFMKILLLSSFVALASLVSAGDSPSISGKWQVHSSVAGTENDMVCTFTQKDDALSGNCTSDQGKFEISGTVSGNKVAWSYKSEYQGTPLTVKFDGTVDAAMKMTGSVDVPEFSAGGDFTATQSK
jgi:hypothetical protein